MKPRELNILLKALFVAGFIFAMFAAAGSSSMKPASWTHLAQGREMIKVGLPDNNDYSFTANIKWDYSSWVFDAFIYSLGATIGADSLYLFKFFMMLLAFFALYLVMYKRQQGKYITAALPFAAYGAFLLEPYFAVTPQIFTLLFISYFMYVLERKPRKRNAALYYSLPFITLLWSNMDISAAAAVVIMLVYLLYRFIDALEEPEKKEIYDMKLFLTSLAGVFLAVFINPSLFAGALRFTGHFASPGWFVGYAFTKKGLAASFPFYLYAGIMALIMLYNMKGADVGRRAELIKDSLLSAVFLTAALKDRAYIPWFLVVSIPVLSYYAYMIFRWDFVWPRQWAEADLTRVKNGFYIILVPLVFIYGGLRQAAQKQDMYPSGAVAYISGTQVPQNIYSEQDWAGYLKYHLYPDYKIMYDPDMRLPETAAEDYATVYYGDKQYQETISRNNLNSFLLSMNAPALKYLKAPQYRAAYFDDKTVIMVDTSKTDRYFKAILPLEDVFFDRANTLNALSELEPFSEDYPSERAQLMVAKIYAADQQSRAIDYLSYMIDKYPNNYKLYNYKGMLLYNAGDYENAREVLSASMARGPDEEAMLKDIEIKMKSK
jgi:hypothetical protein